jgi:hypothetical protein
VHDEGSGVALPTPWRVPSSGQLRVREFTGDYFETPILYSETIAVVIVATFHVQTTQMEVSYDMQALVLTDVIRETTMASLLEILKEEVCVCVTIHVKGGGAFGNLFN